MDSFREHLEHPAGRGVSPPGAYDGSAGGAACGDLIRISLRVEGERVTAAGFDASGCGAAVAAGSAAVALAEDAHVLDAARIGPHEVAGELGGLSPGKFHAADLAADALHRALGAAAREGAALPADPGRTLVAMSGGVDSAVAALLVGEGAAAVTLELWADPANDAEASCCSAHAVRLARSVAHRMGLPHFTLDLREEFRAGVVDPFLAGHAAGVTPNPCVGCNGHVRLDAMVAFADRLGAPALATGHYARFSADGLLRAAADPAKDQTYMLAAVARATLARLRFPLGELTKPQVRALAADAGLPVASKPESQDLCFLAGTGKAAFLARHGDLPERP
ncbi:MAG TPA: iron-sulfur cluster assembly scaffold protein, partial [Solirubrobacteraceae bacterium]|nr:iron-sulfur cluster assembly scaffold protein [Solirubrobacteraceae bacterium]